MLKNISIKEKYQHSSKINGKQTDNINTFPKLMINKQILIPALMIQM